VALAAVPPPCNVAAGVVNWIAFAGNTSGLAALEARSRWHRGHSPGVPELSAPRRRLSRANSPTSLAKRT
jgi:hypothetical protein